MQLVKRKHNIACTAVKRASSWPQRCPRMLLCLWPLSNMRLFFFIRKKIGVIPTTLIETSLTILKALSRKEAQSHLAHWQHVLHLRLCVTLPEPNSAGKVYTILKLMTGSFKVSPFLRGGNRKRFNCKNSAGSKKVLCHRGEVILCAAGGPAARQQAASQLNLPVWEIYKCAFCEGCERWAFNTTTVSRRKIPRQTKDGDWAVPGKRR